MKLLLLGTHAFNMHYRPREGFKQEMFKHSLLSFRFKDDDGTIWYLYKNQLSVTSLPHLEIPKKLLKDIL